ncbi:OmpP1/FadL family transporter [Ruegeria arenilitoris]|uniref:Outer membrane protein transport protein (OMPP1/FadL/TodX) n=1 Tax=Ruegeria arenilitoris TaxID=1173585 RepID=A0A238JTW9_9RHOB|nr:outer membrane protein transport protein [Ruegeria arenilitoris]SMX34080.1 Outer membrane protein transport protein (OMPP1/FadL/TodX) [Ruegeria arenilitoris]
MKKALLQACVLCAGATAAHAGGIDRSGQGINIIFEEGSVVQFRLGYTNPSVSGTMLGVDSGNVANDFFSPHLAYKHAFTDQLDFALIYDEPFGADIAYGSNYPLSQNPIPGGRTDVLRAKADTEAITALLRYKFDGGFSAIGGLRIQRLSADVAVPAAAGYEVNADKDTALGYVVGVAWEKPEIAARVALTYNSKISHDLSQTESVNPIPIPPIPPGTVATFDTSSEVVSPQSVNLDFQTGVAPKTLLFGSIRWVDWPQTVYDPPNYPPTSALVDYDDPTWTYSLGLGYQFSEQFSGAVTLGYESATNEPVSNLGPTDGFWSIGLGGTYSMDRAKISGGVRYTDLGDATADGAGPGARANFSGNSAWSVGIQVTYALN